MSDELEPASTELVPLSDALAVIEAASGAQHFTAELDQAVDAAEDSLLEDVLSALGRLDMDTALAHLVSARQVRSKYLELLNEAATEPSHPMADRIDGWRRYAVAMSDACRQIHDVVLAFVEYRRGEPDEALRILDLASIALTDVEENVTPLLALQGRCASENLTGLIRAGVLDHAGARAAYDRAAAVAAMLVKHYDEVAEEIGDQEGQEAIEVARRGAKFQRQANIGSGLRMQHQQLLSSGDFAGATEAARMASDVLASAANEVRELFPSIATLVAADSLEAKAQAQMAEAQQALERSDWEKAGDLARDVRETFEAASRTCLETDLAAASTLQERYLNAGFAWTVQFRRQIERERSHVLRTQELEAKLRDLDTSLRSALAPAGVTVTNATEMVNSVQQHVAVTNTIEANLRALLNEVPATLAGTGLPAAEKEALSRQALELASDQGDPAGFFERVRNFGHALASAVRTASETAEPVVALLNALAIIG